jgi:hypothetical protein
MPRKCSICHHPKRPDIEADLRAGVPSRDIARRRNISQHVLWRHCANHVSQRSATVIATATKIQALLNQAETASMWNATLVTVKEARHCVEELLMQLKYGVER